jgi:DMSO/TMAO reductase YedYZ molybdopterin-dependent catalytic subunit
MGGSVSKISRRRLIITGLAGAAGASGLGVAAKLAERYGLIPPDAGVLYGAGETLTCAAQRILTRHSLAREFSPSDISKAPFANEVIPLLSEEFHRMQRGGFADWRLTVDGVVGRPASFSLRELKSFPSRTQITLIACEDGWSYIAEWSGGVPPLSHP